MAEKQRNGPRCLKKGANLLHCPQQGSTQANISCSKTKIRYLSCKCSLAVFFDFLSSICSIFFLSLHLLLSICIHIYISSVDASIIGGTIFFKNFCILLILKFIFMEIFTPHHRRMCPAFPGLNLIKIALSRASG